MLFQRFRKQKSHWLAHHKRAQCSPTLFFVCENYPTASSFNTLLPLNPNLYLFFISLKPYLRQPFFWIEVYSRFMSPFWIRAIQKYFKHNMHFAFWNEMSQKRRTFSSQPALNNPYFWCERQNPPTKSKVLKILPRTIAKACLKLWVVWKLTWVWEGYLWDTLYKLKVLRLSISMFVSFALSNDRINFDDIHVVLL